jgi:hypothetical protein
VDPRAGLDNMKKLIFLTLTGLELRLLGRPACRQSLHRLRYSSIYEPVFLFLTKTVILYFHVILHYKQL